MENAERRIYQRIPIDMPIFVSVLFSSGESIPVLLKDISRGGLQAALSPGNHLEENILGSVVFIEQLDERIDSEQSGLASVISWQSPERLGFRFLTPLDTTDEELNEIIRTC